MILLRTVAYDILRKEIRLEGMGRDAGNLFELHNIIRHTLQRVISGCGGQPDFSKMHEATSFSGVYTAESGSTFLLADKRKVRSA